MDNVLKTEVLLNMINTTLAKALHFKDEISAKKISDLRHSIYYGDFDYEEALEVLKKVSTDLNKYE